MKNPIFKLALLASLAFGLCGCDKYLDRTPLDSNSDATNWTSESALETYAWNLYGDLGAYSYGTGWTRGQYHSESYTDDYAPKDFVTFTTTIPTSANTWNNPYTNIRKANVLLARVDEIPNLSEEAANHWRGVARFFRALHHFALVQTYGDVVWVDSEISDLTNEETLTRSRDSRVTVMDNVVADLEFAMTNCYTPAKAGTNTINNMVAAALLSRAALYEGAWEKYHGVSGGHADTFYAKAKDAAGKVIESGLYTVNETYKENYTSISLEGNTEILLYMVYTIPNVNGGKVSRGHATSGYSSSSDATWGLTKSAVENYTTDEGIPVHMLATYDDQTVAGVFDNRDARLTATIYKGALPVDGVTLEEGIHSNTGYWTFKFVPYEKYGEMLTNSTWKGPSNDTDGPIFAYPEVLENYAEACAELGSITQADLDKSVNLLRVNHGSIPGLTLVGTDGCSVNGTTITKDANDPAATVLLQELRRDRRSELMGDGFRHADLMRWMLGKNLDYTTNPDGYIGASKAAIQESFAASGSTKTWAEVEKNLFFTTSGYLSPYNTAAVANSTGTTVDHKWDDKYYLEPIPSGQITLDPNLGQNPGW